MTKSIQMPDAADLDEIHNDPTVLYSCSEILRGLYKVWGKDKIEALVKGDAVIVPKRKTVCSEICEIQVASKKVKQ